MLSAASFTQRPVIFVVPEGEVNAARVKKQAWARTQIDRFVIAKLEAGI